ncbi:VOC family protein [Rhizobium sp. C1]|uniref:VOC family protein n=1 Tax=Rhizobium sp. C1 TaxID=1349799 RepID=UPI001E294303|nr:VOC family protein [Rhizobium sp. C1]MCD2179631.1 VOC family protein [Rhizobium sp. C1]
MAVRRIVPNIGSVDLDAARSFYIEILGLDLVMDHGWIATFAAPTAMAVPQLSVASEGGSGTPVPHISIEVDDLEAVLARIAAAGLPIEYGPTIEPWGVRRFYIRDPAGTLLNVLQHI